MKIKFNTNIVVNVIIGAAIILCIIPGTFYMLHDHTKDIPGKGDLNDSITNLKPIDPVISTNLPYYKYVSISDSIKNLRNFKNQNVTDDAGFGIGYVISTTGSYILCDTCNVKNYLNTMKLFENSKGHTQYFIQLPGWKLKASTNGHYNDDSVRFFRENNQSYIRKKVVNQSIKNKSADGGSHYVDIPVLFGYSQHFKSLLIPVNESTRNVINIILGFFMFIFSFYIFYLFLAFLKFIVDLSKGLAFTDKNVSRLRLIAVSLLVYPLILFLLALLMKLIFHRYFTPDVTMNEGLLEFLLKRTGLGLVFLLLFRAFNQGKLLKDEQDLTV